MLKKIRAYMEQYHMLSGGDTVVAGVSGGADSVCLLFALQQLRREMDFTLLVVHVNHGIRPEAGEDAAYVAKICKEWDVPFFLVEEDVETIARHQGISVEEAGRRVRYDAFRKVLLQQAPEAVKAGRGRIAVAHNSNDRAETMLFHLFRGTGLKGLCGIRPVRNDVIRPLLGVSRQEIEIFLREKGIAYCIDRTNEEDTYTRNKIRHHILPYAEKEIAEGAVNHMTNTADLLLETEDFIRQSAEEAYGKCRNFGQSVSDDSVFDDSAGTDTKSTEATSTISLDISRILTYHTLIRRQIILQALEELVPARRDITAVHVRDILSLIEASGNRQVTLPYNICARREYDKLIVEQKACLSDGSLGRTEWVVSPDPSCELQIPGLGILDFQVFFYEKDAEIPQNQYTKWFDYDKIERSLKIRTRMTGDFLTVNKTFDRKSLQDYMVNEKIPRQIRDTIWLLADGEHIIWVIGYRISEKYKVNENTKRILQVQLRGGHKNGGTC